MKLSSNSQSVLDEIERATTSVSVWGIDETGYQCLVDSWDATDAEDSKADFVSRVCDALAKPDLDGWRYFVR